MRFIIVMGLSGIAGYIDVIGYLTLYHVFVANMTGNTIALGAGSAESDWSLAIRRGSAIPFFVLGMTVSRFAIRLARASAFKHIHTLIHLSQAALILFFLLLARGSLVQGQIVADVEWKYFLLIGLLSAAMGIQNASFRQFGALRIYTTHITGTLAKLSDEVAKALLRKGEARKIIELSGVWITYLAGAFLGALLRGRWRLDGLVVPVMFLVVLAVAEAVSHESHRAHHR